MSGSATTFDELLALKVVEAAPDGIVVVDGRGTIVSVNPAAEAMFGWPSAELVGGPVERLLPERLRVAHVAHRDRVVAEPRARAMGAGLRLSGLKRDGSMFPVEISLSPVETPRGHFTVASVRDITERERTEEALRQSDLRLRELVEQASDGIFVADLEGRYTDVNSAACRMLGFSREELLGKTIMDLIPPEEVPRLAATRERLLAPGAVQVDEWTLRCKDGVALPVEVSAKILADGRWQAFVRDITQRQHTAEALRASEESLRRAQSVAHLGSWDWDLRTNVVIRSPQLYELYGVARPGHGDEPALSFAEHVPIDERDRVLGAIQEAIRAGRSYSVEHRFLRPDGEERVFLQRGETFIENGAPARAVGTTFDITELRRAEREREAVLRELHAVLDQCPVGIMIVRGPDAAKMEPNRQSRVMLGDTFASDEGLVQYAGSLLDVDGVALDYDAFPAIRALRGEHIEGRELRFRRSDGTTIPIEVSAAPVLDETGQVTAAVAVWEDITVPKELERLRAEWNSVIAHDLRQPINSIGLYAQLLARQASEWPEKARAHLAGIEKTIARLGRMTNDLLDLSRLDANRLTVDRRPLDLAACVRESVDRIALEATERQFDVQVHGEIPPVDGDPDRLAQVMENLLSNAVKYGRADAPVLVAVERVGEQVAVAVTNEGAGIDPEELPRLFRRFQRMAGAVHRRVPGVGLGLQITKGLVEAHGGQITAESVPGGATTFRFTLPLRA